MAGALGSITIELRASLAQMRQGFAQAEGQIRQFASSAVASNQQAASSIRGLAGAITPLRAALAALVVTAGTLFGLVAPAAAAEEAMRRLRVQVEAQGASWGTTKPVIDAAMSSMQRMGFTTAEASHSMQMFLERGANVHGALNLMNAAAVVASATGRDLTQVTYGLAQAQSGSYFFLRRMGLVTTEEIQRHISLAEIIDRVTKKYGEQAGQIQTVTQASRVFGADMTRLRETIGSALLAPIRDLVMWLDRGVRMVTGWIERFKEAISQSSAWKAAMASLEGAWRAFSSAVGELWDLLKPVAAFLGGVFLAILKVISQTIATLEELVSNFLARLAMVADMVPILRGLSDPLNKAADAMHNMAIATLRTVTGVEQAIAAIGRAGEAASRAGAQVGIAGDKMKGLGNATYSEGEALRQLEAALRLTEEKFRAGLATYAEVVAAFKAVIAASPAGSIQQVQAIVGLSAFETRQFNEQLQVLQKAFANGKITAKQFEDQLRSLRAQFPDIVGEDATRTLARIQEILDATRRKSDEFAAGLTKGLTEVIEGTKNVAGAFRDMLKSILDALASDVAKKIARGLSDMLVPEVQAGGAAAGAPVAKPGGGGGILGDIFGFFKSLLTGGIPSFQGGGMFRAPGGGRGLAVLHDRETVAPAGSAGGPTTIVNSPTVAMNVSAIDSRSFEDRLMGHAGTIANAVYAAMSRQAHDLRRAGVG